MLRNGFTIAHARRDAVGSATRLWLCEGDGTGYLEVPAEQIVRIEQPPPAPAPDDAPTAVTKANDGAAPVKDSIANLINHAASNHQIDPDFVASVVKAESGFNPAAVSSKGAVGLMQLMPQTAAEVGVKNALDPAANVEGGTKYLRQLLDQYGGDAVKALAAYNAGPGRVEQYRGVPPYRETRAYINRVIEDFNRKKLEERQATPEKADSGQ